ncbi:MAG: YicC/YloC family endoribonuclease [Gammaproteobacteria bacterium]
MIKSMTGFARSAGQGEWGSAVWEIRSVNHRYLEISSRLPEEFRALEAEVRERIGKRLDRGKVDCLLRYQVQVDLSRGLVINEKMLQQIEQAIGRVRAQVPHCAPVNPLDLLRWPGVIDPPDAQEASAPLLALLDGALEALVNARCREGERLSALLSERCESVRQHIAWLRARLPEIVEALVARIKGRLLELGQQVDPGRVEQELVLLIQRLDVAEELDRLQAHADEVTRVIQHDKPVGRRLDFLLQEMNREANTLGSKSVHIDSTGVSVELKVLIEQMREQVQNIE